MLKECLIFLNTKAGALKITPGANTLEERLRDVGLDADLILTENSVDMRQKIRQAVKDGVRKVVVAGGDGTVHLAAQELVHTDVVLGIIPMGTSNNFATALNLPMELAAALRTIKEGQVREVSVGKIGDQYFIESAGTGFFADTLALYGKGTNKNIFKGLYAFLRMLVELPRQRIKITLDGKEIVERATLCTVANIYRIGQAYPIAPDAKLTDDVLDVVIIGNIRRRDLVTYFRAIQAQVHPTLPKVQIEKAKTITIESLNSINVYSDDRVQGTTPVTISIEPRALKVMTSKL